MNYSTFICPSVSGRCGREKKQTFEDLETGNSFLDEVKSRFIVFEGLSFGEKIKNNGHKR